MSSRIATLRRERDVKTIGLFAAVLAVATPMSAHAADAGETLFQQRCAMCHKVSPDKTAGVGPNLRGVVGRQAAATPFNYSAALKKAKLKWDSKALDAFLTAPGKVVPGTRMVVSVPDPKQRAALIGYMAKLK